MTGKIIQGKFTGKSLPIVRAIDVKRNLVSRDLVEGVLERNSTCVVYGEPSCGKTFWVCDIAMHIASFDSWNGAFVKRGIVVYIVMEGSLGFLNRVSAWMERNVTEGRDIPFLIVTATVAIINGEELQNLVETIRVACEDYNLSLELVVIDTLARAMPGGEENSGMDMGRFVASIDLIRSTLLCCVLVVHHSGKNTALGARGHTSLRGAIDTEIEIINDNGNRLARVTKQRDGVSGVEFPFRLNSLVLGQNERGKNVVSCWVEQVSREEQVVGSETGKLSYKLKLALRTLTDIPRDKWAVTLRDDIPMNVHTTELEHWRRAFYSVVVSDLDVPAKRQAFHRVKRELLERKIIGCVDNFVWITKRDNSVCHAGVTPVTVHTDADTKGE